ncbi:MAG: TetR/AcrR family transcriptional regulator [Butyrivibrio sp.]|nr:TetR/AcrR family transcriptional regulator [Butyrivibrio sp.]
MYGITSKRFLNKTVGRGKSLSVTGRARMNNVRQSIMDAVISQFNQKGMKFTMDDVSKELHISKKTIYKEFNDKDELFLATVEYGFNALKEKEAEILADESLDIVEKLSRVIVCLPDNYRNIDFRKVYQLKDKYPAIYNRVAERVESDWDATEKLMREAIDAGYIRNIPIEVIKLTIEGAIEKFLSTANLSKTDLTYEESLNTMIDIVINGIRKDRK